MNPLAVRVAWWMPGLGLLEHTGCRSGRTYRTPLIVLREPDRYLVVLAYGRDTDWIRNIQAAGQACLRTRRQRLTLTPRLLDHDPGRSLPLFARLLRSIGLRDLLELKPPPE